MKRLPRLWRKRRGRGGKFYGNYLATIAGEDVNLGTQNAEIARERLAAAVKGKRDFSSGAQDAAAAIEQAELEGAAAAAAPDEVIPPRPPSADGGQPSPPSAAPAPPALPPMPPAAEAEARAEAEATNAAAADTAGAADPPPGGDAGEADLPPEVLEQLLLSCGQAMVEVQLELQGWIVKKRTGKEAGKIPPEAKIRPIAAQAWVAQFKRWFPDIENFPPWVVAVALPALCIPAQVAMARPAPPPETPADPGQAAA